MAKVHYKFNRESLSYEVVKVPLRTKIIRVGYMLLASIAVAIFWITVYSHYFDTPKSLMVKRSTADLLVKYELLQKQFDDIDHLLSEVQMRDDNMYRAVFGEDPIPSSIRESGFGGANRYEHLEGMANSNALINATKRLDILYKKAYIQSKSFDVISNLAINKDSMLRCMPAVQPVVTGRLSSLFNPSRLHPVLGYVRPHDGIDITIPTGTPIYVTGDGIVTKVERSSSPFGYGYRVDIDHGFGYVTRYAHLSQILVEEGQRVKRLELIAKSGNTGITSGPHLHYEVRFKGVARNPLNYFDINMDTQDYKDMLERAHNE